MPATIDSTIRSNLVAVATVVRMRLLRPGAARPPSPSSAVEAVRQRHRLRRRRTWWMNAAVLTAAAVFAAALYYVHQLSIRPTVRTVDIRTSVRLVNGTTLAVLEGPT